MEEEQVCKSNYQDSSEDGERVREWETGLPDLTDLTPLSQQLISSELASAFSITSEPFQTMLDVNRASQNTLSSLRRQNSGFSLDKFKALSTFMEDRCSGPDSDPSPIVVDEDEVDLENKRKMGSVEEADSALRMENLNDDCSARTTKRPRLVWTPQLHKRFVEVVGHLGIDNAVPKTIMQLMNVEGLTRENVASHLQKYRLYLKRMNEGATSNDQLFMSTPVPERLPESSGSRRMPLPPGYGVSMQPIRVGGQGHMGMSVHNSASSSYSGFEFHPYSMSREPQAHWSNHKFGSVVPNSHVTHDK